MATRVTPTTYHTTAAAVRLILVERFPKCFMPKGAPKLPLALGVGSAIKLLLPEISARHLNWALSDYTHGPTYLRNITVGALRINLAGDADGVVLESEAAYAAALLAQLLGKKRAPNEPVPAADSTGEAA